MRHGIFHLLPLLPIPIFLKADRSGVRSGGHPLSRINSPRDYSSLKAGRGDARPALLLQIFTEYFRLTGSSKPAGIQNV